MKTQISTNSISLQNKELGLEHIQYAKSLTKAAALACYPLIGQGDEKAADQAAVNAMRKQFNDINISGRIVIGEGERDEAPMLYIGEEVGAGGEQIDIAVDPLEGTTICAHAAPNSISVLAMAPRGGLLHAPDVYMEKISVGPGLPDDVINLLDTPANNIKNVAKAMGRSVSDITVCILKRDRHSELIAKVRESGARVQLITDGDVSAVIATSLPHTNVDIYMGSGGAPEGVLAAAALACIGGQMQGKLLYKNDEDRERTTRLGVQDLDFVYNIEDMVRSDVIFSATGVTDGWMLKGVRKLDGIIETETMLMHRSERSMMISRDTDYTK